jgi:hypothetical protein
MKQKYGWKHASDYVRTVTPYKGATKAEYEKKHTVPDHAKDIKKLIKRIETGRPKPDLE